MNLSKTYVQVPDFRKSVSIQMTLDNDFNVADSKPDIERVIQEKGNLYVREIKPMRDKCLIRGELVFAILYIGDDGSGQLQAIEGTIPFEEIINIDGMQEQDDVDIRWDMEDLRAGVINSRKINIRSIVILNVKVLRVLNEEVATAIKNEKDLWVQNQTFQLNQCQLRGKDQLRIREEVPIPANRPNMLDIIWNQENLENLDIKLQDGFIWIRGQISVFLLYRDEMMENSVNDVEFNVPIDRRIDIPEITQEMIPDVKVILDHLNLEVRNDSDGEARVVGVEAVLAVHFRIYQEENIDLLQDIYSMKKSYIPEGKSLKLEHLILKNKSQCPVKERVGVNQSSAHMLQICHARANVKLDQMEMVEDGILVEGVVYLTILYISADDRRPVNSVKAVVPFSYTIEAEGVSEEDNYDIDCGLEQLTVNMTDSNEVEVKMVISLDALVFKKIEIAVVNQVKEEELDFAKIESMPSMVGHVITPEDTIWTLSKCYYASPEDICEVNDIKGDELPVGQTILIMKNMEIFK